MYYSGECGVDNGGKKGEGGVGLAVRTSITRAARPLEFISDRLLKVTLELRGRAKVVTIFVAYAPTETQNASNEHVFWTSLDRAVEEAPKHEQLFVSLDTTVRTRTVVRVARYHRPHGEEGEGAGVEQGYQNSR